MVTITRREVRQRGFFGWVIKGGFIIFNIVMVIWLFAYWKDVSPLVTKGDQYARAGGTVGATIGTGVIFFFWSAGAVILGLLTMLTRGKLTIIEERQE